MGYEIKKLLTATALATTLVGAAFSGSHSACGTVTFSDVGWTDITATTTVLNALGYETEVKILSVPVTYVAMAAGDVDIILGNWIPTMEGDIAPYREAGTVDTVRENLEGAKYTLAVSASLAAAGLTILPMLPISPTSWTAKCTALSRAMTATG